jgi:hypothetical protein
MATELQNKLFRNSKEIVYLAELMSQQIYPRLIEMLKKTGMQEVRFDRINGWYDFCVTVDCKLQFFSGTGDPEGKNIRSEFSLSDVKICPIFMKEENKETRIFESPFPKYKKFCETVVNKLEEMEKSFSEIHPLILKIEAMGVSLERSVIFEKTEK